MRKPAESFYADAAEGGDQVLALRRSVFWIAIVSCVGVLNPGTAWANPEGGIVIRGDASVSQGPGATTIDQRSGRTVINWNGFSIDRGELTQFKQPGKDSIALNRVVGPDRSDIQGQLKANGNVWLVNRNGVLIGPDAKVDAHGFMATTADIDDDDFMAGRNEFSKPSPNKNASVVNEGTITIGEHGLAALVAPHARNDGVIQGKLGTVVIAGTPTHTVDFYGDGLIQFEATSKVKQKAVPDRALAENNGKIDVDGGTVLITANAAAEIVDDVINVGGVVEARSFEDQGGRIVLDGGDAGVVTVAGKVDVSGAESGAIGGTVKVLGEKVGLLAGAQVDASGDTGGGEVLIGGNFKGDGPETNAKRTSVDAEALIKADAVGEGDGGRVIVWADEETVFQGTVSVRGGEGGGDGGFVEVSGRQHLTFDGFVDAMAPLGEVGMLLLDPVDVAVVDAPPGYDPSTNTPPPPANTFYTERIEIQLTGADLALTTSETGPDQGDITVDGDLQWTSGNTLTLNADNDIFLNNLIDAIPVSGSGGSLVLNAGGNIITGLGGVVEVGRFTLESGNWEQNGASLPAFSVNDFRVSLGANFLRVLGGDGSAGAPYLLTDVYGLQGVGSPDYLASDFRLANDIDAGGTTGWYVSEVGAWGFVPIGEGANAGYSGSFDGAGFTISDLYIDRTTDVGLFQTIEPDSDVRDLTLSSVSISGYNAGGLAAQNRGLVENVSVSGDVIGSSFWIDFGDGTFFGGGDLGGLVGSSEGAISNGAFNGDVTGNASGQRQNVGGLAGRNDGTIADSSAAGTALVVTDAGASIGGLVGIADSGSSISASTSTSSVSAFIEGSVEFASVYAGGFLGRSIGTVSDGRASGSVTVVSENSRVSAGGFVGFNARSEGPPGRIMRSLANGDVNVSSGGSSNRVGGFAGDNSGEITQSRAEGDVGYTSTVAQNQSIHVFLGGFTGTNFGELSVTGAFGNVNASPNGQLVSAGGHTGSNIDGEISDGLAQGDVTVTGDAFGETGGLVGWTGAGAISRTYSSGAVSVDASTVLVGGLIGLVSSDPDISPTLVVASYWDQIASGQPTSAAGTGLTTAELQNTLGFQALTEPLGWDFQTTWAPGAPGFYPDLYAISPVIYTEPDDASGVYGQLASVTLTGSVFGGPDIYVFDAPGDTLDTSGIYASDGFPNGDAGTYPIGTLDSINSSGGQLYRIVSIDGTLTVTPAPLTITALDQSKTYGDTFTFNGSEFEVSGLVAGDSVDRVDLASGGAAAAADVRPGGYSINSSNAFGTGLIGENQLPNYDIGYVDGILMVNPAPLTVRANDAVRLPGQENPPFTASFDGFKLGETSAVVEGLQFYTDAGLFSPPGAYDIMPFGATAANYDLTFEDGVLVIWIGSLADVAGEGNPLKPDVPILENFGLSLPIELSEPAQPVYALSPVTVAELAGDLMFSNDGNPLLWGPLPSEEAREDLAAWQEDDDESGTAGSPP